MSDTPDKESPSTTQQPAPCEKCGKPFAVSHKFSVASLFQTDPGEGLSRWQEYCKCDSVEWANEFDLPLIEEPNSPPSSLRTRTLPSASQPKAPAGTPGATGATGASAQPSGKKTKNKKSKAAKKTTTKPNIAKTEAPKPEAANPETPSSEVASPEAASPEAVSPETPIIVLAKSEATETPDVPPATAENRSTEAEAIEIEALEIKALEIAAKETRDFQHAPEEIGGQSSESSENIANSKPQQPPELGRQGKVWQADSTPGVSAAPAISKPEVQAQDATPAVEVPFYQEQVPAPQVYMIGDRYQVESVIGKGTFGPTYRAKDVATERTLCLKMVSTPISRHRRIVKRIMQEVEKAKTLNHPHIVPIYDSGIDKTGRPFYVMDLIEPGSLKNVIRQEGFLDVPEVIDIFLDVCEALSYAHEHGILHRDLKPGNILLSGKGTARRAKVSDFGIVKALPSVGSEAQEMTQSTDVFADPSCMSPEQCLGRRIDIRSDIYSLGCSMYQAIVGKKVFSGPNALSVVVQHFKALPRAFDTVMYNCDISPDVEAVVFKMLEKAPEHRYQEVSQVVEDLRLLKAHRKPAFAYQKKKGAGLNLMLPFSVKEEPDKAERLFDIVLNKKKLEDKKQHQNWNDEARQQVAADINRLAKKGDERNLPQVKLLKTDDSPDHIIARAPGSDEVGPSPSSQAVGPIEFQQKHPGNDVIRPNMLKMPTAPGAAPGEAPSAKPSSAPRGTPGEAPASAAPFSLSPAQPMYPSDKTGLQVPGQPARDFNEVVHVYRASDLYPALPELFEEDVAVTEDAEEVGAPIITVEQAKREIPEYLLQISRTSGFVTLPMIVALFTAVSIIIIMMQMVASAH
jgi:serine/threonine protein kinase